MGSKPSKKTDNGDDEIEENTKDSIDLTQDEGVTLSGSSTEINQEMSNTGECVSSASTDSKNSFLSNSTSAQNSQPTSSGYGSDGNGPKKRKNENASLSNGRVSKKQVCAALNQIKKQKLAEERSQKQNINEINKMYRPGECMKHMHVQIHGELLSKWYCADIEREVTGAGANISTDTKIPDSSIILWHRETPKFSVGQMGQSAFSGHCECDHGLVLLAADDLSKLVAERRLAQHMTQLAESSVNKLTLVVYGTKDYFKSSGGKKKNDKKLMTEIELEMAFTDLLVCDNGRFDVETVNTPNELALLIVRITKSIAEKPNKKLKQASDEQAQFYMRGENKKCVPVDKDGHGLSRLWQQMVAVVPSSSLEISRALCAQYKSPLALYLELQTVEGVSHLADVGVSRDGAPEARARRLGPELAQKLSKLFNSDDGDMLLD